MSCSPAFFFLRFPEENSLQKLNDPSCWQRVCFSLGSLYDFSMCKSKSLSMWKHGLKKQLVGRRPELGRSSETQTPVADGDGVHRVTSRVACGSKRKRNIEYVPLTLHSGRGPQTYSGLSLFFFSVLSVNNILYFSCFFISTAIFFKISAAVAISVTNGQTSIIVCFMTLNLTRHCKYSGS